MDPIKQKLLDIYSPDPNVRVAALAKSEPIHDATAEAAINTGLLTGGGEVPLIAQKVLAASRGIQSLISNHSSLGSITRGSLQIAAPWSPGTVLRDAILKRVPSIIGQ